MSFHLKKGFSLLECVIASAVAAIIILGTLSLISNARLHNEIEQERSRAHQIVCQKLEVERYRLFTWTQSESQQVIWDNGTPSDPEDDTLGTLEVIVRNPANGQILTRAPEPAILVEIEVTLSWEHRGSRLEGKKLRETVMTYKTP